MYGMAGLRHEPSAIAGNATVCVLTYLISQQVQALAGAPPTPLPRARLGVWWAAVGRSPKHALKASCRPLPRPEPRPPPTPHPPPPSHCHEE